MLSSTGTIVVELVLSAKPSRTGALAERQTIPTITTKLLHVYSSEGVHVTYFVTKINYGTEQGKSKL
jgi:hypothetical protein